MTERPPRRSSPPLAASGPTRRLEETTWWGLPVHRFRLLLLFVGISLGSFALWIFLSSRDDVPVWEWRVVNSWPHDTRSFTQGLLWHQGHLFESTGQKGRSKIRKVELETGTPLIDRDLDPEFFGEGIAVVDDRIVQLTWQNGKGIVYDLELDELSRFDLEDDAWGLTFDGQHLIMSDGTSVLHFLDKDTYEIVRDVTVRYGSRRAGYLNELEYINGLIYANVWQTDEIVVIQPQDGKVVGKIDLRKLYPFRERATPDAVLNGIAVKPDSGTILVTGKYWPRVYELELSIPK